MEEWFPKGITAPFPLIGGQLPPVKRERCGYAGKVRLCGWESSPLEVRHAVRHGRRREQAVKSTNGAR